MPPRSIFVLILLLVSPAAVSAQTSLLESVLTSRQAVVLIEALRTEARASPHVEAAIHPQTGQLLIARNVKTARLKKTGAGVIITSNGLVVANLHTVFQAQHIAVKLFNGKAVWAKVLHILPDQDLALLKIDVPVTLPYMRFADSNQLQLGQEVIHIGASDELRESLSGARITGLGRSAPNQVELIRVNITIYKGDSGGPLLDRNGELVGIMVAGHKRIQNASFAIPGNKIKELYFDYLN